MKLSQSPITIKRRYYIILYLFKWAHITTEDNIIKIIFTFYVRTVRSCGRDFETNEWAAQFAANRDGRGWKARRRFSFVYSNPKFIIGCTPCPDDCDEIRSTTSLWNAVSVGYVNNCWRDVRHRLKYFHGRCAFADTPHITFPTAFGTCSIFQSSAEIKFLE